MPAIASENSFTVALACYHWLAQNHSGMSSPEYQLLSKLREVYQPSSREEFWESIDQASKDVFDMIESVDQCQVLLTEEGVL